MTPHLVALYAASSGMPMRPPIDDVTTIRPKRCRRITGMAARRVWKTPVRLVSTSCCQTSSLTSVQRARC